jgi:hypothetical protein
MAAWVEIPACRILIVPHEEIATDWELIDSEGLEFMGGYGRSYSEAALFRRRRDGKVMRPARVVPFDATARAISALEEL